MFRSSSEVGAGASGSADAISWCDQRYQRHKLTGSFRAFPCDWFIEIDRRKRWKRRPGENRPLVTEADHRRRNLNVADDGLISIDLFIYFLKCILFSASSSSFPSASASLIAWDKSAGNCLTRLNWRRACHLHPFHPLHPLHPLHLLNGIALNWITRPTLSDRLARCGIIGRGTQRDANRMVTAPLTWQRRPRSRRRSDQFVSIRARLNVSSYDAISDVNWVHSLATNCDLLSVGGGGDGGGDGGAI